MTTIAYRSGIMAADSRAYNGNRRPLGTKVKIENVNGVLIGVSSASMGLADAVRKWLREGRDPDKVPKLEEQDDFEALIAHPNGLLEKMDYHFMLTRFRAEYAAVGTGAEYALGAMYAGYHAEHAVAAACYFDVWSDPPIITKEHKDVDKRQEVQQ